MTRRRVVVARWAPEVKGWNQPLYRQDALWVKPRVEFQLDAKLPLGLAGLRVQVPEQGLAHGLGGRPPESLSAAEHLGLDVDLTCPYARQASVSLLFCAPAHNHLREEFR